jgi:hypothetical protein
MRKTTGLLLLVGLAFPGVAKAAGTKLDCLSPAPPKMHPKDFVTACIAQANATRVGSGQAALTEPDTVLGAVGTVAEAELSLATLNVPGWSDANIKSVFQAVRDTRYLTDPSNPTFPRRISWLYPESGCEARAHQVVVRAAAQFGLPRPWKLWAFAYSDPMVISTPNAQSGSVQFVNHVAAVVKTLAGEPIVIDPALSPCRPLPWKEWLAILKSPISYFDSNTGIDGVAVADSNGYAIFSQAIGGPQEYDDDALEQQQGMFPDEWNLQVALGRDPNVVLGPSPPWSGYNCMNVEQRMSTVTVAPNASVTLTAACPFSTLAVGGGFWMYTPNLTVSKNAKFGNGWQIVAKNVSASNTDLNAYAECLIGAPNNATVSTVTGSTVNIAPSTFNTSSATCGAGTVLVGGGFSTTQGSTSVMRVYANRRSTSTSSSWQASAQNTTATTKSINAYAHCLANTSFTANQTSAILGAAGLANASCGAGKVAMGGGFVFPRTTPYTVTGMVNLMALIYEIAMSPAPPADDPSSLGYAECLAHP